jgi:putative pyrroloquinoline-quinone binding quinoprotein
MTCLMLALLMGSIPAGAQGSSPMRGRLWTARYRGPGNGYDFATAVGVLPDGATVVVTGYSAGSGAGSDYATVAYDAATGTERWVARYSGPGNRDDDPAALAVSPDGVTVFVTGNSWDSGTSNDYATVAYDAATGAERWVARYNGPGEGDDFAKALEVSPDGATVFVTGWSMGSGTDYDYATVAYDEATGTEQWVSRYNGPGNNLDSATALGMSQDGATVFVTGSSVGSGTSDDYATLAYDAATGTERWVSRYNGPGNRYDDTSALGVSPDGTAVFVTGSSQDSGAHYDYATVAYDASAGAERWVARYDGPANDADDAYSLGVSPDGGTVFVTGNSWGSGTSNDYATAAYDATTGAEQWVARYNGPGNGIDYAYDLEVRPDAATVFVTGYSEGSSGYLDYATLAYDAATGQQRGVTRIGPGSAYALRVNPEGTALFVTGSVGNLDSYGTVAYSLVR